MAGHTAGGSNSEAHWRVTLGIAIIGDLEGQTQRRNGGSPSRSPMNVIPRVTRHCASEFDPPDRL